MKDYLPFIVIGIASGSVYALTAMGLTLTYITSGVFNFAHGATGMAAAYLFYTLRVDMGVPTLAAVAIVVFVFAPLVGTIIDRVLLPRLAGASTATYIVASLGLLTALQGLVIFMYGSETRVVAPFLPQATFDLPGVTVGWDQVILVLIALAVGAGMWFVLHHTSLGLRMRAVVDDPELTEIVGTDARSVTTFSWCIGTGLAALTGVLLVPLVGLDATVLTLLAVQAFGAAMVGRLTSLPMTYLGALLIGIAAAISTKYAAEHPLLQGLPTSLPFIVLFLVLLLSKKGSFREVTPTSGAIRPLAPRGGWPAYSLPVALLVAALAMPWIVSGLTLQILTTTLVYVLIFRSLGLLVGMSRQVSLAHAVFVALGATTVAHLTEDGIPFGVALTIAALVMIPVGAFVAIPAIRLRGLFLAIATFGFGLLVETLIYPMNWSFGSAAAVYQNRPNWLGIDFQGDSPYYFLVLAVVVVCVILMEAVARSRLGRVLRALGDSETAVESLGVTPLVARVLVFCLSCGMAAVAGGLLVALFTSVTTQSFDFFASLVWVTVLVTCGTVGLGGAILAAIAFIAIPELLNLPTLTEILPIIFGIQAIVMAQRPNGLIGANLAAGRRLQVLVRQSRH